ncbi:hypothetical protein SODALDRAFT_70021 [Sodiomyces alkalinus F11]|uniref:Uncharacterized protein n=1 Tax=Sodiomyces alkalinus (strain CBS 110278 / VKM F-3762 / F11) TaxID=1314773 RepID=A0A3N2PMD7_SODAK|nr:hypothetical protein SODALDRAFT_70021 [Sodiomyces alkalinus F11]ROT35574.1 hypothetical protein SODALDRAFT_70021 [Sodiomyces alkalinus F11]
MVMTLIRYNRPKPAKTFPPYNTSGEWASRLPGAFCIPPLSRPTSGVNPALRRGPLDQFPPLSLPVRTSTGDNESTIYNGLDEWFIRHINGGINRWRHINDGTCTEYGYSFMLGRVRLLSSIPSYDAVLPVQSRAGPATDPSTFFNFA